MTKGIDLLSGEREARLNQEKRVVKIRFYGLLVTLIFIFLIGVVSAYAFFWQKVNNDLVQQLILKRTAINDFKNVEGLQTVLVQRLAHLDGLLAKRDNNTFLLLDLLQKIMPSQVSLVKLSPKDNFVSVYLEATTPAAFDDFMTAFNREINQETFPFRHKIELTSLNRNKEGFYAVVINLLANQLPTNETPK
jgi:hypothetical protein